MGTPDAIIAEQVATERAWALAGRDARLSYTQLRALSMQSPDDGGLGYELSESAIRALARDGYEARGDLTETRAERIQRQAAEIDAQLRGAMRDYEHARRVLSMPLPDPDAFLSPLEYAAALGDYAKMLDAANKAVDAADRRIDAAHKREAALLGLDAAQRIEADVTTHDGTLDDLNAALARLGKAPLGVEG